MLPVPEAFDTVNSLSMTKVTTVKNAPINKGTKIPPSYIFTNAPFGP